MKRGRKTVVWSSEDVLYKGKIQENEPGGEEALYFTGLFWMAPLV